jgi:hypothetical protein
MYLKFIIIIIIIFIILKKKYFFELFNNTFQGPEGDFGDPGFQGEIGHLGLTGEQGSPGKTGKYGERGKKGPIGIGGPMGGQGEKGQKGEKGQIGIRGKQGITGNQGDEGLPGPKGFQGSRGPMGLTGLQGPNGPQGELGRPGTENLTFDVSKTIANPFTRDITELDGNPYSNKKRLTQKQNGSIIDEMRYPMQPIPVFGEVVLEKSEDWWAKCSPNEFLSAMVLNSIGQTGKFRADKVNGGQKKKRGNPQHKDDENMIDWVDTRTEVVNFSCSKAIMRSMVDLNEKEYWIKYPRCCASKTSCKYDDSTIGQRQSKSKFECEETFKGYWDTSRTRCCAKTKLPSNTIKRLGYCYTNKYLKSTSTPKPTPSSYILGSSASSTVNSSLSDFSDGSIYQKVFPDDNKDTEKIKILEEQKNFIPNPKNILDCHSKCKKYNFRYSNFVLNTKKNDTPSPGTTPPPPKTDYCFCSNDKKHKELEDKYRDEFISTGIYDTSLIKPPPPLPEINDNKLNIDLDGKECVEKCEEETNGTYTGSIKNNKGCFCSLKKCPNMIIDKNFKTFVGSDYHFPDCSFKASNVERRDIITEFDCNMNHAFAMNSGTTPDPNVNVTGAIWSKPEIKCPGNTCLNEFVWERMNPRCCNGLCTKSSYKHEMPNGEPDTKIETEKYIEYLQACKNNKFIDAHNKDIYCCETSSCAFKDVTNNQKMSSNVRECHSYGGAWDNDCNRCQKIYDSKSNIYISNINDIDKCRQYDGDFLKCIPNYNFIKKEAKVYT